MEFKINFINQKKEISVSGGTLADACKMAGYPLNLVCGGRGTCGKCGVFVERNGEKTKVLACKTEINQDETVWLPSYDEQGEAAILEESDEIKGNVNPAVYKVYKTRAELEPEHCGAYFDNASLTAMKKFSRISTDLSFEGCTLIFNSIDNNNNNNNNASESEESCVIPKGERKGDRLIDVQQGNTSDHCYGAAIDIGTTTVVMYLYDLLTGKVVNTYSALNKQMIHGADVIARIFYAQEKEENLKELQNLILETVNEMFDESMKSFPFLTDQIYHVVICGNSTMQHLFWGMNPGNLGVNPFANITNASIRVSGEKSGLHCAKQAIVEFLPLLAGFVGADTLSVLLTLPEDRKKYLIVDLGTNGEIAVGNHEGFYVSSTACGPALEGGNIECGMRGVKGAIEKISLIDDSIKLKIIGNGPAAGLCGSGIIDAVEELIKIGVIDEQGRMLSAEEYAKKCPDSSYVNQLRVVDGGKNAFFFSDAPKPVYLSQQDVRQIQLVKSSIYSGCVTLLKEYGIGLKEVDCLILAGAFGNYINIDHALAIGLLPKVAREKIISIGNGAGKGVQSILIDQSVRKYLRSIPEKTKHIELADHPEFMDEYIMNMYF